VLNRLREKNWRHIDEDDERRKREGNKKRWKSTDDGREGREMQSQHDGYGTKTKPSAVPPPFQIPLKSTPLTTVAEPRTMLAEDFLLRVDGSVMMQ